MANKILNEENSLSSLVEKLVANWLSKTGGKPAKVEDLVAFLQDPKVQKALPYNEDITDEVINSISTKRAAKGFGQDTSEPSQQPQRSQQSSKPSSGDQTANYAKRLINVISKLSAEEQQALSRIL